MVYGGLVRAVVQHHHSILSVPKLQGSRRMSFISDRATSCVIFLFLEAVAE